MQVPLAKSKCSAKAVDAGVVEAKVEMGVAGAPPLEWSIPLFQSMIQSSEPSQRRSALARATYQGVQLRMQQEAKQPAKRAKGAEAVMAA